MGSDPARFDLTRTAEPGIDLDRRHVRQVDGFLWRPIHRA
jgi:hypothetical protein